MRALRLVLTLSLAAALVACSDDAAPGGADASSPDAPIADAPPPDAPPDAAPPDAAPPDAASGIGVGKACMTGTSCGFTGAICLDETIGFPAAGYCSKQCTADADCGDDSYCTPPLDMNGTRLCFLKCNAAGGTACDNPAYLCETQLAGFTPVPQGTCMYGNAAAVDGDACTTFGDCDVNAGCLSNAFDFPGGYCVNVGCTPGDDTTCPSGGDAHCVDVGGGNGICVDGCTGAGDCRTAEGYACVTLGAVKGCVVPHASVGDACTADAQCGPVGLGWQCLQTGFPGGYCGHKGCTVGDAASCPMDSTCFDPTPAQPGNGDTFCAKPCPNGNECRMGYTCDATAKVCRP